MIEFLAGVLRVKRTSSLILDVNGVGYGVSLPLSHHLRLPQVGKNLALWIYTRVREDQLSLFGFLEEKDRFVFEMLMSCSGVGPKVALAIMSTMTSEELVHAVGLKDQAVFESVPGIGKRTAEKILVDLQTKVDRLPLLALGGESIFSSSKRGLLIQEDTGALPRSFVYDLNSALTNLGFKDKEIKPIIDQISESYEGEDFSSVTRRALSLLSAPKSSKKSPDGTKEELESLF